MLIVWVIAKTMENPSVVDVAWPCGLVIAGFMYLCFAPINLKIILVASILLIWGLRLASHLFFSRIKKGIVDKRYLNLSKNWQIGQWIGFLFHFQLQGWLIFIVSSVFFFISSSPYFYSTDCLGIICCLTGMLGEKISDNQLLKHRQTQSNQICNAGLWYFSRHPNYFFDWLTWLGFAIFGIRAKYGWLSLLSPLTLYFIMLKVTIPITEQGSIESKKDLYLRYQQNTSKFFPWFKK